MKGCLRTSIDLLPEQARFQTGLKELVLNTIAMFFLMLLCPS